MARLEKSGTKTWWPMKQFMGRDKDNKNITKEVYKNMVTGQEHEPLDRDGQPLGWNGNPPDLPKGEKIAYLINSEAYRRNYDLINWDKK
jgi:hypothetical protein